ncbi:thrombospondin type-1 domain-containing protein 7B [Eucyclogobius newberryi]|uniref:thrombospondin type-1 domain-containing protein 7B n=1 Tax=Eucyclogobius newberryi TaxID=166745 RepID=UPI003B59AF91
MDSSMSLRDDFGVNVWTQRAGISLGFLLLLAIFPIPAQADMALPRDHHFSWKAGQWDQCVGEECGSGGFQTRTLWCVHAEGWTTHHSHCSPRDRPETRRPCFKVCGWHQDLFEWDVSEWGACVLVPFFSNELKLRTECVTAQHGIQRRKVHCVRTTNRTAVSLRICEFFSQKPAVEQACLIPCPQDCIVSDFTSWSSCSRTCGAGLQYRTRHVLATPMYGGAHCPNLTETRTCNHALDCPAGEDEHQYSLKVGAWSECRLPHDKDSLLSGRTSVDFTSFQENNTVLQHPQAHPKHPRLHPPQHPLSRYPMSWELEVGYRTRQVRCTRSDGKNVMLSLCSQTRPPLTFQSCIMPGHCLVSDWSSWTPCSKTCRSADLSPGFRLRTRTMTQIPVGGGNQCPALEEKEACNILGDLLAHCPRFVWRSTDWGECRISPLLSQQDKRLANISALCGAGIQTRKTYCIQIPDDSAPHHRKEVSRPVSAKLCAAEEPPSAVQSCSLPCQHHCLLSPWSDWGPCLYDNCRVPQGKKGEEVSISECEDAPPPTEVPCERACPGDCVVGSWSPWSPCSHSCASKSAEGRQSRTRPVLALPGKEGKACPAASALEEWRMCNDHPCLVFYWDESPWGPCIPDTSMNLNGSSFWNGTSACAIGVQIRKATCMKINSGQVVNKRCPDSARPETVRPCLLPCKKDCVVTPFSEWTPCPASCVPENGSVAAQSRYRTIIQRPSNGGQECPDTLYEERECEALPVCPVYRWRTHKWHSCSIVPDSVRRGLAGPGEFCGDGLETRGVSCIGESGEAANMTLCLLWAGPLPPQTRGCRVPCKDDCSFTTWSKFTECSGCGTFRARTRTLTGRSKKKEQCADETLNPLEETEACPCDELLSQPFGNWSECLLPNPPIRGQQQQRWRSPRQAKGCGQGLRVRAVSCVDQSGRPVDPTLCTETGFTVELCIVPCPLDCKLSDWSAWSACSASCGSGVKLRSKWLREKAFNGGRPCPKLDLKNQVYEAVPCHSECSQYEWRIEPWSICTINSVSDGPLCGEGVQSRKIRCVKLEAHSSELNTVEDSLCDQEDMPPRAQVCSLSCPQDCVLSLWGPWTNCLQCDQNNTRTRSRHVLRLPANEKWPCPDLIQSEPCVQNSTCFTYEFKVSDWSTCQLSENALCGQGSKVRRVDCLRGDGKMVELHKCEQFVLLNNWTLSESCEVDCPVSCVLSDWSPWAECSHSCGSKGQSLRARRILQKAHEEGRPCPGLLTQTRPCPIKPCYDWVLSDWSPCIVEGAECGEGIRRRGLSCLVHLGDWPGTTAQTTHSDLCGDAIRRAVQQEMEQPCFVPCPGDCHLTEWSTWSSCQLTCVEGRSFESSGRQARSRAVVIQVTENQASCPHQLFETQPCNGGKCHSYQWRTGAWSNNQRAVWCQRSDGVNVTGGCYQQKRPTTMRHCHPPCTKPFSHCTPSGVCGCERGYTEVMSSHGFLDYCTRTPGVDSYKKADVKTNSGRLKPGPAQAQDVFTEWTLRPVGPDGRVKIWVYAVIVVGFILILFIIALSFLLCTPSHSSKTAAPQKPLSLAYDGDMDM